MPSFSFEHCGGVVDIGGESARSTLVSPLFQEWLQSLDPKFKLRSVMVQSADVGRQGLFFLKFSADIRDDNGRRLPGIVFARQNAVAVLIVLKCGARSYALLVSQPRVATGKTDFLEIVAGVFESDENFTATAVREIKEETGLEVSPGNLIDLTKLYHGDIPGMFSSPGASNERVRLFACEIEVTEEELVTLSGRRAGLAEEGEHIVLRVMELDEMLSSVIDMKSIAAYALYQRYVYDRCKTLFE